MRRTFLTLAFLLAATAVLAANPYYLDRDGVLWNAGSAAEGLVLTGLRDGAVVVRSVVPFPLVVSGTSDTQIQVAADELTGKVVVVWQRNWSDDASEIMLAVWRDGKWERVEHLAQDLSAHPRNPTIQLSDVATTVPDAGAPDDPSKATVFRDSFLHAVWWEGPNRGTEATPCCGSTPKPTSRTRSSHETSRRTRTSGWPAMRRFRQRRSNTRCSATRRDVTAPSCCSARSGSACSSCSRCGSPSIRPRRNPAASPSLRARRHMPIFGVRKAFVLEREASMVGARVILGASLNPVVYRVVGTTLEYFMATETGWSPQRTLSVTDGMTMDQAIPLVEKLAR
jgi:hypothetical protein